MATPYIKNKVYLTPNQIEKVKEAFRNNKDCTLRIQPKAGNTELILTVSQINKILQAKKESKVVDIKISKTQLKKSGGFLPILAGLASTFLPFITKAAATGAVTYAGSKAAQKLMGKGRRGKGIYIPGKQKKI